MISGITLTDRDGDHMSITLDDAGITLTTEDNGFALYGTEDVEEFMFALAVMDQVNQS